MAEQWALVSDFDGTVSADDFFTLAAGRYFTDEMLEPWREYLSGRKKHFDALNEMFGRLRGLPDLPAFVKNIPLDSWFPETVALCHAKKIPVYICSAGCDWYINLLIGGLIGKYGVCLVTNHCDYSVETGLVMKRLPEDHPCYDDNICLLLLKIYLWIPGFPKRLRFAMPKKFPFTSALPVAIGI